MTMGGGAIAGISLPAQLKSGGSPIPTNTFTVFLVDDDAGV